MATKIAGLCATAGEFVTLEFNAPVASATHPLGAVGDFDHNKVCGVMLLFFCPLLEGVALVHSSC